MRAARLDTLQTSFFWFFGGTQTLVYWLFGFLELWIIGLLDIVCDCIYTSLSIVQNPKKTKIRKTKKPINQKTKKPKIRTFEIRGCGSPRARSLVFQTLFFCFFGTLVYWTLGTLFLCFFGLLELWCIG